MLRQPPIRRMGEPSLEEFFQEASQRQAFIDHRVGGLQGVPPLHDPPAPPTPAPMHLELSMNRPTRGISV